MQNFTCSCGEKYHSDEGRVACERSHVRAAKGCRRSDRSYRLEAMRWEQAMHKRCGEDGHRKDANHPNRCKWCGELGVFRYEDSEQEGR